MNKLTILQRFSQARAAYNHTSQDVADKFKCSRGYIYKVMKYPGMNREVYGKICEYIEGAGIDVPEDEWQKAIQPE